MRIHVIYSYDMNVLRAVPEKGPVECLPLTLGGIYPHPSKAEIKNPKGRDLTRRPGGRQLKPETLQEIAAAHWIDKTITKFTILGPGQGYKG